MKRTLFVALAIAGAALTTPCMAQTGSPILQPGDPILGIDVVPSSQSRYPSGEAPMFALDGDAGTKYLNFGRDQVGTGLMVTPAAGATTVTGLQLTTANDAPERDPAEWVLYGTNNVINHDDADNMGSTEYSWTLISQGLANLPDTRGTLGPLYSFAGGAAYTSYRIVFPTVKDAGAANSMQIADVALLDAASTNVLAASDPVSAFQLPFAHSASPGAEGPANLLDGDPMTKYLNFGEGGAGFIVTPAAGSPAVASFQLTTANDYSGRDPASWQLHGTNDPISGDPGALNWTLIDAGPLSLPGSLPGAGGNDPANDGRLQAGAVIPVNNTTAYASYRMVFPTLKDPNGNRVDSMQIADVQFFAAVPEPSTMALAVASLAAGCLMRRNAKGGRR